MELYQYSKIEYNSSYIGRLKFSKETGLMKSYFLHSGIIIASFILCSFAFSQSQDTANKAQRTSNEFVQATCKLSNLTRIVKLTYDDPASKTNCKVRYIKETENVPEKVLWSAISDYSFCQQKAIGFVSKLESLGWVCAKI